jgi:hypothetical protein
MSASGRQRPFWSILPEGPLLRASGHKIRQESRFLMTGVSHKRTSQHGSRMRPVERIVRPGFVAPVTVYQSDETQPYPARH